MDYFKTLGKGLNDIGKQAGEFVTQANKEVANHLGKATQLTEETMMSTLDWAYDMVITGIPGQSNLDDFVTDYLNKYDADTAIEKLIRFQTTKAATAGFVAGLGGFVTMPVAVPANVATVILFQIKMIAAIAKIRGYDVRSDQVKTFVYATLAGTSVAEISKKAGIVIGNKLAMGLIKKIPGKVLVKINQAVGFRLATKFGTTGVFNLGRMVPVVGAVVGGAFDSGTTLTIANLAKSTFTNEGINLGDGIKIPKDVTPDDFNG